MKKKSGSHKFTGPLHQHFDTHGVFFYYTPTDRPGLAFWCWPDLDTTNASMRALDSFLCRLVARRQSPGLSALAGWVGWVGWVS